MCIYIYIYTHTYTYTYLFVDPYRFPVPTMASKHRDHVEIHPRRPILLADGIVTQCAV